MLTKAPMEGGEKVSRDNWALGALTSVMLLALLVYTLLDGFGKDKIPADLVPTTTGAVSDSIFGTFLVPFEVVSVLLLAALIGAIVIARRD
jgi:NADH-quinone oxidoreductase subunit J